MIESLFIVEATPDERDRIVRALAGETIAVEIYDSAAQFLDRVATTASGCVLAPISLFFFCRRCSPKSIVAIFRSRSW